jgi:hypothetical protein
MWMLLFHLQIALFCLAVKNKRKYENVYKIRPSFPRKSNSEIISSSEFERVSPWQREGDESIVVYNEISTILFDLFINKLNTVL